jgi:sigma-B regulation protein RsbU (phosphoserine phosphatase)
MEPTQYTANQIDDLESRLEAKKAELRDLATMGTVVTSIHEINAVLSVVMDMAVRLVDGEVGSILLEEEDTLHDKISWGVDESFIRSLMYRDNLNIADYSFQHREPVVLTGLGLVNDAGLNIESIISVPIKTAQKCFGVISIINKADGTGFSNEDREILEMLMNFVAVAIDNSILIKDKLKQQKTEQEMAIAKQVQETILPQDIDSISGAEIGVAYYPAREVGGDFYDIIKVDNQRFVAIIGDVSNKGVPAALVMSAAAGIIKSTLAIRPDISMAELAESINEVLASGIIRHREMFVTLFLSKVDLAAQQLTYCNAGHLPGLLWDHTEGTICELPIGGPIIGQFPGCPFKEGQHQFESDDRLFLFTDGLTEAADANNQLFGRERAEQVFSVEIGLSPKEFCVRVKDWVDRYTEGGSEEYIDDFTIMQIKVD